jgi:hypothetical protein
MIIQNVAYLCYHHMAIKCALPLYNFGPLNMRPYLCDDRSAKCEIGHKMAIHHVYMDPCRVEFHKVRTGRTKTCKVSG